MNKTIFVAGTDTDVGKTVVSRALLQAFNARGLSTIGFKPVAAGCEMTAEGARNSDALYLQSAASIELAYDEVNPVALMTPASPHIAAKIDDKPIDTASLSEKLHQHQKNADFVLVEGAGGWRVPIADDGYLSEWVADEKLPVILVVGVKLGCLSHAILTAEAIKNDGLEVVGWVANRVNPCEEHYRDIITFLESQIGAPKIGEIPYMRGVKKKDLSKYINLDSII
ncbi:dethiobiotin synthase [Vibrio breoganii]|uniref:ATP-dependent dethiobiotin synthetase BioD n=1 Tax=Vibrio breoganii TaxID=553239 RepID=A0AAN0XVD4_9VIBR|nr:dethiobiotin synthase [Vibrio breoganii]ANO33197.1 dethiobiotin synthase [Vibrio breoganii]OED90142.1 dethiobiotin synthase [Vibrio breoganii ZF-55]PMG09991.1 dethiobiotin synthase [Vibrio breoganii]PMG86369.1 dethiobiotin synthase [Vibrio breoganii]PMG95733.1 dethiobiotin synthase [Vibrio breoganii]